MDTLLRLLLPLSDKIATTASALQMTAAMAASIYACVIHTVTPPVVQALTSARGYGEDFRRHYASIHKQDASTIASTTSHTILLLVGSCSL